MIPFHLRFQPGVPIFEQAVYAAKRAMLAGQLRPGDPFPSVRVLSRELKINPNTAHKVIGTLISEGLLHTQPGIGTVVAALPQSLPRERLDLLDRRLEALVVEARSVGMPLADFQHAASVHWHRLSRPTPQPNATPSHEDDPA